MSTVPFPTRSGRRGPGAHHAPGFPAEAEPCRCGDRRLIHDDECMRCGRLPEHTIRGTWARRAQYVAERRAA